MRRNGEPTGARAEWVDGDGRLWCANRCSRGNSRGFGELERLTAIFADRLAGVSLPRVQHTQRFGGVVHLVGYALGGRGGERLLDRLGMGVSDHTILRS